MGPTAIAEGTRAGAALGVCVALLAVIGLTPSLSWVPEVPLLAVAVLLPLLAYALTGYRVGRRSGRMLDGLLAGAIAGIISGGIGGVSYAVFGKPLANIAVGLLLGALGGALVGTVGARFACRWDRPARLG